MEIPPGFTGLAYGNLTLIGYVGRVMIGIPGNALSSLGRVRLVPTNKSTKTASESAYINTWRGKNRQISASTGRSARGNVVLDLLVRMCKPFNKYFSV